MAGYLKLYVVGGHGGFKGADGVNPIEFLILVGDADRQWLEPRYFHSSIMPIGRLRVIVPAAPGHQDSLLDACIAFCPRHFRSCPSLVQVESALQDLDRLDFHARPKEIPDAWAILREEARPLFAAMNIWQADLVPIERTQGMEGPQKIDLPFFAYGLFRPGQLAFFQLREFVSSIAPSHVGGCLLLRDGLPILDPSEKGSIAGALLTFLPEKSADAYDRISRMEPDKHYLWKKVTAAGAPANVLVGRSPKKGNELCEDPEWNGWNDPLFTTALDVVEETLESRDFVEENNLKPLFRLQMAYLLLWSSIERYVSLRYHLGNNATEKVYQLASEPAFSESLRRHVKDPRKVYRADKPKKKVVLNSNSPTKAVRYYYQVRSNIVHRGKGAVRDYGLLEKSLKELLPIFREVLKAAEKDAHSSAP